MQTYSVIAPDGQVYGPADEVALAQWAREGRINAHTTLRDDQSGRQLSPHMIPSLVPALGLGPDMVQALMHGPQQQPAAYAPYPAPGQPLAYAQPGGYVQPLAYSSGGANWHQLTEFSVGLLILLYFVSFGIYPYIVHFNLMHGKLPRNRPNDPSVGAAIGFMFIPFFNFYWDFFTYLRLIDRINEQRVYAGLPPGNQKGLFIATAVMMFVPFVNYISILILAPIFFGSLQSSVNELVYRTRGHA